MIYLGMSSRFLPIRVFRELGHLAIPLVQAYWPRLLRSHRSIDARTLEDLKAMPDQFLNQLSQTSSSCL